MLVNMKVKKFIKIIIIKSILILDIIIIEAGVLWKRCSENMQQIYRRTSMLKCDFNKFALQLY